MSSSLQSLRSRAMQGWVAANKRPAAALVYHMHAEIVNALECTTLCI